MPRGLDVEDLSKFVGVSDPQVSPEGDAIAFVVTRVDGERDDYRASVWVVDSEDGEAIGVVGDGKCHHPRWSRDGLLLYLSDRGVDGKGVALWVCDEAGGSRRLVARLRGGAEQPLWVDVRRISLLSRVGEADAGVWVVDRIPLWFDAVGFVHHLRRQLHLVDSLTSEVESLTPEEFNVICHAPSPDGRRVAYAASVEELDPRRMVLKVLDLESREVEEHLRGFYIESLCWTDDGHVAFIGNDLHRGYSSHNTVWLVDLEGGELQNLTGHLDRGCSRRIYYDLRSPYATYPGIRWDDGRLYFTISEGGRHNLYRMRPDGQPEPVVEGDLSVDEFSVSRGVVAYIRVAATEPGELWVWEAGEHRRLTNFNGPMLRELKLSTPERIEFKASDGAIIEGWMLRPINQEADRRYPLIMDIHGGPKSKYGYSLMFEHQLYAAKGYVVLYTNPRGSDGYTEEFADIRRRYGTRDYQDLMEAIDHILKHYDFIDPECLGVTGLSYGGFMTNWVVTHTDRFRVAISQNGIADWRSFYWTTDIGFYFAPDQIGGTPWTNEEAYREKSPITYATQVNTPIMFVHSYHDYRCWIDQSIGFYTALKTLGKETRLTLFTEGSHVFRSLAKPSIRKERLKQMLKWFDNHLKD